MPVLCICMCINVVGVSDIPADYMKVVLCWVTDMLLTRLLVAKQRTPSTSTRGSCLASDCGHCYRFGEGNLISTLQH